MTVTPEIINTKEVIPCRKTMPVKPIPHSLKKPLFFIGTDTLNSLPETEEDPDASDFDYMVDLIDMPYLLFYLHGEEEDTLKVKQRLQLILAAKITDIVQKTTENRKSYYKLH